MQTPRLIYLLSVAILITVGVSACDSLMNSSSRSAASDVRVQMKTVQSDQLVGVAGKQQNRLADNNLVIEGDNGTLTISDLRFVLSKFELEGEGSEAAGPPEDLPEPAEDAWNNRPNRDDDDDEEDDRGEDDEGEEEDDDDGDDDGDDDDEEDGDDDNEDEENLKVEDGEFKLTSTFIDVPLDLDEETVLAALGDLELAAGAYDKLEFKIEDPDFDGGTLLDQIRSEFADWPEDASLVAVGTFTPTGGEPREFTVYFDAEVKIEMDLNPPLQVTGDETPTITINFDPTRLFKPFGPSVPDLSKYDYGATGEMVDLKLEFEEGFDEVELEYELN